MKSLLIVFSLLLSFQAASGEWVPETQAEVQKMLDEWEAGDYKAFKRYKKKGLNPNFSIEGGRSILIKRMAGYGNLKLTKNHIKILDILLQIGLDINAKQALGFQTTALTSSLNEDFLKWAVKNGGKLDLVINNGGLIGDFTALGGTCNRFGWNDAANEAVFKKLQFVKDEFGYDLNENGLCSCRKFIPWEPEYIEEELVDKFPELEEGNCN